MVKSIITDSDELSRMKKNAAKAIEIISKAEIKGFATFDAKTRWGKNGKPEVLKFCLCNESNYDALSNVTSFDDSICYYFLTPKELTDCIQGSDEFDFTIIELLYKLSKKTHSSSVGGMNCSNLDFQYIF